MSRSELVASALGSRDEGITMASAASHWIMCPACGAAWDVDPARVSARGLPIRCPLCGERSRFGPADVRPPPNPDVELFDASEKAAAEEKWELVDQLREQVDANRRERVRPRG